MKTDVTTKYGNFAVAGSGRWCAGCGRKLTPDGRCSNCDAWWASPLIRIGGPLLLATVALLALGIGLLRPKEPPASLRSPSPTASLPAARPGRRLGSPPQSPRFSTRIEAPPLPASRAQRAPEAAPAAIAYAEQVRLRMLSAYVDAVIAADNETRARRLPVAPRSEVSLPDAMGY